MTSLSLIVNQGLIPTTAQGIALLASIVSAAAYIFAAALFPKCPVDAEGNPVPSGPAGFPIIGTLDSLRMRGPFDIYSIQDASRSCLTILS
jgi:hypothetical protein